MEIGSNFGGVLRTVSIADALTDDLRSKVLDGAFPPGSTITETDIAANYGVSRPTAKAAIVSLVHSGLLRREANKPAFVPRLTRGDVEDLYFVRINIEASVVGYLAEMGIIPQGASKAVARLAEIDHDALPSAFVAADLAFHRSLVDAAESPRLSTLYGQLLGEIHLSMVQARYALGQERIVGEHGAVLKALENGDGETAKALLSEHLTGACEALSKVFDQFS